MKNIVTELVESMMKVVSVVATAALLVAASNAQSTATSFDSLAFTGYDGVDDCAADAEFLTGTLNKVSVSDTIPNALCEESEYTVDDETFTLWTGIVLTCNSIAIQKEYYTCTKDCASCDETPFQYGVQTWEDAIGGVDTCYSNSATSAASAADADEGVLTVVDTSSWQFTEESEADEVDTYLDFLLDNTCIGDGQPEIGDEEEGVECISYRTLYYVINWTQPPAH